MKNSLILLFITFFSGTLSAQSGNNQALFRSMILPGWGHYYANPNDWNTGKIHLLTEIGLITGLVGLRHHANVLEQNLFTFASQKAGVNIDGSNRQFILALTSFNSLGEYNDYQNRSRNWDRLIDESENTNWNWESEQDRRKYTTLYNRIESARQQMPAIVSLMILNRVISGISAYKKSENSPRYKTHLSFDHDLITRATIRVSF